MVTKYLFEVLSRSLKKRVEMESRNTPEKHREMYKKSGHDWKDQYRKRCHERLKKSREKFMDKFRKINKHEKPESEEIVKGLMVEEWRVMCTEQKQLPSLSHSDHLHQFEFDLRPEENIDEVLYVFEEIRLELLKEEQQILREYEAGCYYDEQALAAAVNHQESAACAVTCPVCQKNPLFINKGVVFCSCGVRVDTETDCLSLENIQNNIEEATQSHSDICESTPRFSVIKHLEAIENLIMTCETCDYMHIII